MNKVHNEFFSLFLNGISDDIARSVQRTPKNVQSRNHTTKRLERKMVATGCITGVDVDTEKVDAHAAAPGVLELVLWGLRVGV